MADEPTPETLETPDSTTPTEPPAAQPPQPDTTPAPLADAPSAPAPVAETTSTPSPTPRTPEPDWVREETVVTMEIDQLMAKRKAGNWDLDDADQLSEAIVRRQTIHGNLLNLTASQLHGEQRRIAADQYWTQFAQENPTLTIAHGKQLWAEEWNRLSKEYPNSDIAIAAKEAFEARLSGHKAPPAAPPLAGKPTTPNKPATTAPPVGTRLSPPGARTTPPPAAPKTVKDRFRELSSRQLDSLLG